MKKALTVLRRVSVFLFASVAVVMVVFTIVSTFFVGKQDKSIFGYKIFTVLTDSMKDVFESGDVIVCKEVDPETLQEGDIITFTSTNPDSYGKIITHKIRSRTTTDKNQEAFITYGTITNSNDEKPVLYNKIHGQYKFKLAGMGDFFIFLKSPPGYIIFIFIPFAAIISVQVVSTVRLYKRRKTEKRQEAEEIDEIAQANQQNAALLEEIRLLKEKAAAIDAPTETSPESQNEPQ